MTETELAALAARAREGDVAARNAIVEANMKFLAAVARRVAARTAREEHYDDLVQEGVFGLIRAIAHWDGVRDFRRYASACVGRRMVGWLRRVPPLVSLDCRDDGGDPPSSVLADALALEASEAVERGEAFDRMTATLPSLQRRVAWARFVDGMDLGDAAASLGVTRAQVAREEAMALDRLRVAFRVPPGAKRPGPPFEDLTGRTFVRLYVEGVSAQRNPGGKRLWRCRCRCGQYVEVVSSSLLATRHPGKGTRSCGCINREAIAARRKRPAMATAT